MKGCDIVFQSLAIDFDMFNAWVNLNSESYILTSWFFSEVVPGFNQPPAVKNDAFAVPTLYGTIAKITHRMFSSLSTKFKRTIQIIYPSKHCYICRAQEFKIIRLLYFCCPQIFLKWPFFMTNESGNKDVFQLIFN